MEGQCTRNGVDLERLPFHRVLNVAYSYMADKLPNQDEEGNKRDYRGEFDEILRTHTWPVPRTAHGSKRYKERVESNAPSWWVDDEEASQSFMMAMGVSGR